MSPRLGGLCGSRGQAQRACRALLAGVLMAVAMMAPQSAAADGTPDQIGQWEPVIDLGLPATHQVLLHNGKVLYWSSNNARVWDPATGQIAQVPAPFPIPGINVHCAGQVVLGDGRVLVVGGQYDGAHTTTKSAEIFDPATNAWTRVADMNYPRWYPTVTALGDGRVLVSNGEGPDGNNVSALEVYDPTANTWTVLNGADRAEDLYSFNYLLPSGRIFNATPSKLTAPMATGLLDVVTRTWAPGPLAHWWAVPYTESGAMYAPGKVIRSGGTPSSMTATMTATNQTEIVDMNAPAPVYEVTSPMAFPRRRHNMVVLADGTVMAVGGTQQADDPAQAVLAGEIWNPDTKAWTTVASMTNPRMYHSAALLLPDGRVLAGGGEASTAGGDTPRTAQVYAPPYLFKGPRPRIAGAPVAVGYGGSFSVSTPDAATVAAVALVRPSAVTHANNMDQRYVPLAFSKGPSNLTVAGPANGNVAPPGWYMLFIRTAAGVPSVAAWVQIGAKFAPSPSPGTGDRGSGGSGSRFSPGVRVSLRRRVGLRDLRAHGLRLTVLVDPWTDSRSRVVRTRLLRVRRNWRVLVTTSTRTLREPESFKLTLRSPSVRRLRPGRYEVEVAMGRTRQTLHSPATRSFTIVG